MIHTVVGSFDSAVDAVNVARKLRLARFLDSDVNIVVNNTQRVSAGAQHPVQTATDSNAVAEGALAGGALGGVAGLAASLMGLAIPGIGPILAAGPIVAALAGAGAGAVAGGLISGLAELDIPESEAQNYAEAVRRGAALVTVCADSTRAHEARAIMRDQGAFDIKNRVEQWRGTGWEGYDPAAGPFTYDEIESERLRSRAAQRSAEWELRR